MMNAMNSWVTLLSGILVGSATGIGGTVIGSWMTGKSQLAALRIRINAEDVRAESKEKRNLYIAFLVGVNELCGALRVYPKSENEEALRQAANQELTRAQKAAANAIDELALFGPRNLSNMGHMLYEHLEKNTKEARSGTQTWELDYSVIDSLLEEIYKIMRREINADTYLLADT
jgi:hypothetical protein